MVKVVAKLELTYYQFIIFSKIQKLLKILLFYDLFQLKRIWEYSNLYTYIYTYLYS